jgi:hypothetical protein
MSDLSNHAAPRNIYSQQLKGIDRDIAKCGELHLQVVMLLESLKEQKDFVSRA